MLWLWPPTGHAIPALPEDLLMRDAVFLRGLLVP